MSCSDHFLSRRNVLTVGAVGGLGLSLTRFFSHSVSSSCKAGDPEQHAAPSVEGTAKSVIFIFLPGGMAQQESFDPKPHAPVEYRGPLDSIGTSLTGVRFSSLVQKDSEGRGQADDHSFAIPWRSCPRTWRTQYVHGLSAEPRVTVPKHGQRGFS